MITTLCPGCGGLIERTRDRIAAGNWRWCEACRPRPDLRPTARCPASGKRSSSRYGMRRRRTSTWRSCSTTCDDDSATAIRPSTDLAEPGDEGFQQTRGLLRQLDRRLVALGPQSSEERRPPLDAAAPRRQPRPVQGDVAVVGIG
jgi:hypothetical protein